MFSTQSENCFPICQYFLQHIFICCWIGRAQTWHVRERVNYWNVRKCWCLIQGMSRNDTKCNWKVDVQFMDCNKCYRMLQNLDALFRKCYRIQKQKQQNVMKWFTKWFGHLHFITFGYILAFSPFPTMFSKTFFLWDGKGFKDILYSNFQPVFRCFNSILSLFYDIIFVSSC